jgi:hypothetical protein
MIRDSSETALAILAYLRSKYSKGVGVTASQVRHHVPLAGKRTPDEVRAYLAFLATRGLAVAEDVPPRKTCQRGSTIPMRVYTATPALLALLQAEVTGTGAKGGRHDGQAL